MQTIYATKVIEYGTFVTLVPFILSLLLNNVRVEYSGNQISPRLLLSLSISLSLNSSNSMRLSLFSSLFRFLFTPLYSWLYSSLSLSHTLNCSSSVCLSLCVLIPVPVPFYPSPFLTVFFSLTCLYSLFNFILFLDVYFALSHQS